MKKIFITNILFSILCCSAVSYGGEISELIPRSSSITGRLYNGVGNSIPMGDSHVFALSIEDQKILAHALTNPEAGKDAGRFNLNDLPAQGEIILVGFHPDTPSNMALLKVKLSGRFVDIGGIATEMPKEMQEGDPNIPDSWLGLLGVAGRYASLKLAADHRAETSELAQRLLKELGQNPINNKNKQLAEKHKPIFSVTSSIYSETDDINSGVTKELGSDYRVADWNDFKEYSENLEQILDDLEVKDGEVVLITKNSKRVHSGERYYIFVRGQPHRGAAAFEKYGNSAWLGSWYGYKNVKILAKKR